MIEHVVYTLTQDFLHSTVIDTDCASCWFRFRKSQQQTRKTKIGRITGSFFVKDFVYRLSNVFPKEFFLSCLELNHCIHRTRKSKYEEYESVEAQNCSKLPTHDDATVGIITLTPFRAHLVEDSETALAAAHGIARLDHVPRAAVAAAVFDAAHDGDRRSSRR